MNLDLTPQEQEMAERLDGERLDGGTPDSPGRYFGPDGQPMSFGIWSVLFGRSAETRFVGRTEVGKVVVSTVWLGLNHQFGDGPPLIFETMVFGGAFDQEQERYSTMAEAVAGHDQWVARVSESTVSR